MNTRVFLGISSACYFKRNVRADLFCRYREAPRVCLFKVDSFQEGEADLFSIKSSFAIDDLRQDCPTRYLSISTISKASRISFSLISLNLSRPIPHS